MGNYKLLIVEDEPFARKGLQSIVDWKSFGIEEIFVAKNGQEGIGIAKLVQPDIILTDIKMPVMDGLQMIKKLREIIGDEVEIAILSGYGEFEYAKMALEYNVVNYLLKPARAEEIKDTFRRIVANIERKKQIKGNEAIVNNTADVLRSKIIRILVHNNYSEAEDLKKELEQYGFPFIQSGYVISGSIVNSKEENPPQIFDFIRVLQGFLKEIEEKSDLKSICGSYHDKLVCIINNYNLDEIVEAINKSFDSLEGKYKEKISVGISSPFESFKEIHKSYEEAKALSTNNLLPFKNNIQIYGKGTNEFSKNLIAALNIIHEEYMKDLNINYIAERLNVSDSYIMHMFKNEINTTFNKTLLDVRLKKAQELLLTGKLRVNEVAYAVGFNDEKYFTIIFKKYIGCTPTQFIKNNNA